MAIYQGSPEGSLLPPPSLSRREEARAHAVVDWSTVTHRLLASDTYRNSQSKNCAGGGSQQGPGSQARGYVASEPAAARRAGSTVWPLAWRRQSPCWTTRLECKKEIEAMNALIQEAEEGDVLALPSLRFYFESTGQVCNQHCICLLHVLNEAKPYHFGSKVYN